MTPQEYMDLPYFGMAEKELRKRGYWKLTTKDKLRKSLCSLSCEIEDAESAINSAEHYIAKIEHEMENLE